MISRLLIGSFLFCTFQLVAQAQVAPSSSEIYNYSGLLLAASNGDISQTKAFIAKGAKIDISDSYGRTPLHIATYGAHHEVMKLLVAAGADPNSLEKDRYDIVTIAAVANDVQSLKIALALGGRSGNITSRYDGTALIAAAHLGHIGVVGVLIDANAPLDHVNNLGWTALIESIVLGDGGHNHVATLKSLLDAGANVNLADENGDSPLTLAKAHRYNEMIKLLKQAGAK